MNLELSNCKGGGLVTSVIFLTPAPQSPLELWFKLSELAFYMGAGDVNSGPQAYKAGTLPTEPSPQL